LVFILKGLAVAGDRALLAPIDPRLQHERTPRGAQASFAKSCAGFAGALREEKE
jgi:hypothetical protein